MSRLSISLDSPPKLDGHGIQHYEVNVPLVIDPEKSSENAHNLRGTSLTIELLRLW